MALLQVVLDYFLNRTDRLANLAPWGKPCPIEPNGSIDQIIGAHLGDGACLALHLPSNGASKMCAVDRVGTYAPDAEGNTKWICIDLDGPEHADGIKDPLGVGGTIIESLSSRGFPSHLERSGGDRGFHVWVFLDQKIQASDARRVAFAAVPKELRERAEASKGVEIFPKQDTIEEGGCGNMVWLPWWAGAAQDCGMFYRAAPQGWLSYLPSGFDRASAADVVDYSEQLAKVQTKKAPRASPTGTPMADDWSDWRRRVMQSLPLENVYGQWLTGKRGGRGWIMCRVPGAPNGDPHPSGSVADGSTSAERGTFKNLITGESLRVIDFMIQHGLAVDVAEANRKLSDWTGIALPKPVTQRVAPAPVPEEPPPNTEEPAATATESNDSAPRPAQLPQIIINGRQLRQVIKDGWDALLEHNKPKTYVRNHELVRIREGENGKRIHPMSREAVHGALLRCATWVKAKKSEEYGAYYQDADPQKDLAADMLAYPHPMLHRLESVLTAPSFVPGGRLIETPGFDERSGIYYDERERIDPVPMKPTSDDVLSARMLIEEDLFVDFPWPSQADKAGAWAAILVPFVRRMISGATPLHLIEAPVAGSGKGLLADLICVAFSGREADVTTLPTDEEETRKKVTSLLRAGRPIITFDNLPHGSKSATLAAILTSRTWIDRKLGVQEMIEMSNRAIWVTTVNNPDFNVDLARRCIRIRIAPEAGRPWERQQFKHAALREWVTENRPSIVHALLTLIQYWVSIGMPRGKIALGSFESWSRIMGGILDHIGVPGFLENAKELYDQADTDSSEWAEFVRAWWAEFSHNPMTPKELGELAKAHTLLLTVRGDRGPSSQSIRMGNALKRMRGRVVDGWRIQMQTNPSSKSREYVLEPLTTEAKAPIAIRDIHPRSHSQAPGHVPLAEWLDVD